MNLRVHRALAWIRRDNGSAMVEMAFACTVLVAFMFGICQTTLALYYGHFCSDAARQATRYAMVRGSTSCTNTPNLTNCNATGDQIKTWVRGLGYPAVVSTNVSVTTSWYTASTTEPAKGSTTTWALCTTGTCNKPGNLVKVVVGYPVAYSVPFGPTLSLNLTSTSQLLISQ